MTGFALLNSFIANARWFLTVNTDTLSSSAISLYDRPSLLFIINILRRFSGSRPIIDHNAASSNERSCATPSVMSPSASSGKSLSGDTFLNQSVHLFLTITNRTDFAAAPFMSLSMTTYFSQKTTKLSCTMSSDTDASET